MPQQIPKQTVIRLAGLYKIFGQNTRNRLLARQLRRTGAYDLTCQIAAEIEGVEQRLLLVG